MNTHLIEDTLRLLQEATRFASNAEQREALVNSKLILFFILGRGEDGAFTEYLKLFNTNSLTPALSFNTLEEADAWLWRHPEPPHGATIGVVDGLYTLAYSRELNHRKLLRIHPDEGLDPTDKIGDEIEEISEERSPVKPDKDAGSRLFDLLNWTSFQLHGLEQHLSSVEEREAIRVVKIAFQFVMDTGEYQGVKEYLETVRAAITPGPRLSFSTRAEADSWLAQQPEPPSPCVAVIGGEVYSVGYNRSRSLRILIRIPTQQELGL